jgi:peptidoglycan/xylan/chitin deacetylase (PgdA/CDA1 family)
MANPLHTLGYRLLSASLKENTPETGNLSRLSRRAFLLLGTSLTSCSALTFTKSQAADLFKTGSNSKYRTPSLGGPVPRNPDMSLSSNFSRNAGISFSRVMVSGNYVAMTFDDGPHPQNTPRLLDILRVRNIKATFFVIGQSVDLYPQIIRRTVAEGHEIGNHTYTHRLLSKLSDSEIALDLLRCRDAVVRAAGVHPRTMRPPYGGLPQRQREMVYNTCGYPTILWSVDPLDWKRPGPSVVSSRILHATTSGSIILSHDLHAPTVDAMPATLDGLLRRGFQFVTVSQLLAMKSEALTAQADVPGDNSINSL